MTADSSALTVLQSFLDAYWAEEHLPASARFPFDLALEEIFLNVVMHGRGDRTDVTVDVALHREADAVELTMRDNGLPFDPLALQSPDVNAPMEDRAVGGLGLHLIRTLMDSVTYRHECDQNVLVMRKQVSDAASTSSAC